MLRKASIPPRTAPASVTEFGPTVEEEVKAELNKDKLEMEAKAQKSALRTTAEERGGKKLIGFLARRFTGEKGVVANANDASKCYARSRQPMSAEKHLSKGTDEGGDRDEVRGAVPESGIPAMSYCIRKLCRAMMSVQRQHLLVSCFCCRIHQLSLTKRAWPPIALVAGIQARQGHRPYQTSQRDDFYDDRSRSRDHRRKSA